MKDYHDLLILTRSEKLIDHALLKANIQKTFDNRKTPLSLPIAFGSNDLKSLQTQWTRHLQTFQSPQLQLLNLPTEIIKVINELNHWLSIL